MKKFIIKISFVLFAALTMIACSKNDGATATPKVNSVSPDSGASGTMVTIQGMDLTGIRQIYLDRDSVPVPFNPVFNTNEALLIRVPDTASGGDQNLVLVKANGAMVTMPFKVIALATVTTVSNYNFVPGDEITLSGNNLESVTTVVTAEGASASIISQSKKEMTIKMPQVTAGRTKLTITNASGASTTSQEFANIDNAYQLFTDTYQNNVVNASWGPATISTSMAKSGTASFAATYNQGNWSADGFANWSDGIPNLHQQGYNYFTFWVYGGLVDQILYLTTSTKGSGYGNSDQTTPLNIKAGTWNYFKISLATVNLWANGNSFQQIGWWIKGPNDSNETFYFDDVMFVK